MLNVQKYLRENSLESLLADYKLNVRHHDTLPLVILNYDQIESPRNHPISNECRGLILEKDTWNVVARAFPRFFNLGEYRDIDNSFVWEDSFSQDKEDGSLMTLFQYNGVYHCCTRGSFADQPVNVGCQSWSYYFWAGLRPEGVDEVLRYNNYTLVFEFCSPYNKVVRYYKEPQLFLLTAYDNSSLRELSKEEVDGFAAILAVKRPQTYVFTSANSLKKFVEETSQDDHTYEGIVVRDINGLRLKIKNAKYVSLSRLKGNGNLFHPKYLVEFVLDIDAAKEMLCYFPEAQPNYDKLKGIYDDLIRKLENYWFCFHDEKSQKKFALAVKECPLSSILFLARKSGWDVQRAVRSEQGKKIITNYLVEKFNES